MIYFLSLNHTEGKLEYSNLRLNLTDGHFSKISNISELSTSRVVDQNTGIVYIGTGQGIYRYDPKTKETKYILRESIVTLRFNKKLYFSRNKHGICTLNENYVKNCIAPLNYESIHDFVVDKKGDIYYRIDYYFYSFSKMAPRFLFYKKFGKLSVDKNNELYIITVDEISKFNYDTLIFETVGSISKGNVTYFVFDGDNNIIFEDVNSEKTVFK